jgi:hypothetical protein
VKLWKYLLIALMLFSALFQLVYGCMLMNSPESINTTLNFENISSNEPLKMLIFMYGKIFLTIALMSILIAVLIIKDSPYGIMFTIGMAVAMINGGVMSFVKTDNTAYLFADLVRGSILLAALIPYYFWFYRGKVKG